MVDIPATISYVEIVIMVGVWLNTSINIYNLMKARHDRG